jgi:hypothetical protein
MLARALARAQDELAATDCLYLTAAMHLRAGISDAIV